MKYTAKLVLSFTLIFFVSCKSAEFKVQQNIVKAEISDVMEQLADVNETKLNLTSQLMKMISVLETDNITTVDAVNESRLELSETIANFKTQKLSKRTIRNFFKKQNDLSINLEKLLSELENNSEISGSNLYGDLMNAFQRNKNISMKIIEQFNGIIEKNVDYVNYSKFKINGI